jgi:Zn-finger in ubiquitin-hydrolases and other protein
MTIPHYAVAENVDGNPPGATCQHLGDLADVRPSSTDGCEDCLREGTRWVHLRECLNCGHIGCCDNSPRRHATAHFHRTSHPLMRSFEPGEDWAWCYPDSLFLEPV